MSQDAIQSASIDQARLRDIVGEPHPLGPGGEAPVLEAHARKFISLSPFLCLGTADADGKQDVSPRGDPPGFVTVLNERTIAIPDRPGNKRVDSMSNIAVNPEVGIVFFVPGIEETLRINGRATITEDEGVLAGMEVKGKVPKLAIVVSVEEVFFHCAKALKRSKLWDEGAQIERGDFPTMGQIMRDLRAPNESVADMEEIVQGVYRDELY